MMAIARATISTGLAFLGTGPRSGVRSKLFEPDLGRPVGVQSGGPGMNRTAALVVSGYVRGGWRGRRHTLPFNGTGGAKFRRRPLPHARVGASELDALVLGELRRSPTRAWVHRPMPATTPLNRYAPPRARGCIDLRVRGRGRGERSPTRAWVHRENRGAYGRYQQSTGAPLYSRPVLRAGGPHIDVRVVWHPGTTRGRQALVHVYECTAGGNICPIRPRLALAAGTLHGLRWHRP